MNKTFVQDELPEIVKEILGGISSRETAVVLALSGDLGAGKTTFSQSVARALGVRENVISPTFVIMKSYEFTGGKNLSGFSRLVHIDAYRLDSHTELTKLGWNDLIADPQNLILIEWPEKVAEIIPKNAHKISLSHVSESTRQIRID